MVIPMCVLSLAYIDPTARRVPTPQPGRVPLCVDPHEEEILFAPLAGLEVRSSRVEGSVIVVEVRANINLNALTIEQVIAKRHRLIVNMGEGIEAELLEDLKRHG